VANITGLLLTLQGQGNAAFKAADYPTAIGHYTDAILADSSDHTFFLNRAAAYLKLGKYVHSRSIPKLLHAADQLSRRIEDAERDCTKVLALNPNNVKALFRRGQARRALWNLDDAQAGMGRYQIKTDDRSSVYRPGQSPRARACERIDKK
jgi:tetratricopeptide (TPR) repeat protein